MKQYPDSSSVPSTLEGWAVLHEIYKMDWTVWRETGEKEREETLAEAVGYLEAIAKPEKGESAIFSLLGHKGDLLLLHFRPTLDALNEAEIGFRRLAFFRYLEPATSYLSFLELGLYEMTVKLRAQLIEEGLEPDNDAWKTRWEAEMAQQRERTEGRLYMEIPSSRYLCFYPMSKRRGEEKNWYALSIEKRQMMMRDHGMVGRRYAGKVQQIITGSIGFDDWEWGVYLFASDPIVFKDLVYEMRFDEASIWYGEFGAFYSGLRFMPDQLPDLLSGKVPSLGDSQE